MALVALRIKRRYRLVSMMPLAGRLREVTANSALSSEKSDNVWSVSKTSSASSTLPIRRSNASVERIDGQTMAVAELYRSLGDQIGKPRRPELALVSQF